MSLIDRYVEPGVVLAPAGVTTFKINSTGAAKVWYFVRTLGTGVDVKLQARGTLSAQGESSPVFREPGFLTMNSSTDLIQELSEWPFLQSELVITNQSANSVTISGGMTAVD